MNRRGSLMVPVLLLLWCLSLIHISRGEITLLVEGAGAAPADAANTPLLRRALQLLLPELPVSRAAAIAAQLTGVRRGEAYELALQLQRGSHAAAGQSAEPGESD